MVEQVEIKFTSPEDPSSPKSDIGQQPLHVSLRGCVSETEESPTGTGKTLRWAQRSTRFGVSSPWVEENLRARSGHLGKDKIPIQELPHLLRVKTPQLVEVLTARPVERSR